ncbi:MAG: hypothetical protein P1P64_06065 [Treponemataceae bacterium]
MKKLVSIFAVICLVFSLVSCPAGLCAIFMKVKVCVKKDDTNYFSKDELNKFNISISVNGHSATGGTIGHAYPPDGDGQAHFLLPYYLGSAHTQCKIEKIRKSYEKKLKDFSFTIQDPSGKYKTFTMDPLDDSYEVIRDDERALEIQYTVSLEATSP